ncbi:DoxX family protein [Pseudalkalibacillus decolorationis]|uniref:DoxX family protein n=1 Tax=Pseudalkalibacillus decolorationis TaxID=163879 RepID=UPI0021476096|nr:DoxX family protein [Pseudalkalibacillus decolorationis]
MAVLSIVLQSLLTLYFVFSGVAKIAGEKYWVDIFKHLELPQWFRVVTGFVQLIGAVVLIIGYWYTGAVAWAGIWLGITMLLACLVHFRVKDSIGKTAPAFVFALLNITLIIINAEHMLYPFS